MGKQKKKKNRKKTKYNRREFIGIICDQCRICAHSNPRFCYEIVYQAYPDFFLDIVYPKLFELNSWLEKLQTSSLHVSTEHFKEIFCTSGMCGYNTKHCGKIRECFRAFLDQIDNDKPEKKHHKKKHETVAYEPYPTFFISENEAFKKEVEIILHGN